MATSTTRLQLRKPADADNVDQDLDLNDNYDKLDAAVDRIVANAAARLALTPYTGMYVLEADTGITYWYTGSVWKPLVAVNFFKSGNALLGDVSLGASTTGGAPSLGSFTLPVAMKVYIRVDYFFTVGTVGTNTWPAAQIKVDGAGGSPEFHDWTLYRYDGIVITTGEFNLAAGSRAMTLQLTTGPGGSGGIFRNAVWTVQGISTLA